VHLAGAEVTRISHDELSGGPGTAKGSGRLAGGMGSRRSSQTSGRLAGGMGSRRSSQTSGRLAGGMGSRRSSQTSGLAIGTLSCAVVQVCGTVPAVGLLAD